MPEKTKLEASSVDLNRLIILRKAYSQGLVPAAYEAFLNCVRLQLEFPDWLTLAMRELLVYGIIGERPVGKGRAGNVISDYRERLKHYERFSWVVSMRDVYQESWKENKNDWLRTGRSIEEYQLKYNDWMVGKNWDDAYQAASDKLKGHPAWADPATIRSSYLKVNKYFKETKEEAFKYLRISDIALNDIGLGEFSYSKQTSVIN